jgi:hypothetical protein
LGNEEVRLAQLKTDEQLKAVGDKLELIGKQLGNEEVRLAQLKTDEQLKAVGDKLELIGEQLGNMGIVQGEIAEDLFYRNTKEVFRKKGFDFQTVKRNLKKKGVKEYDIVAVNSGEVLVIEVKNKLDYRMVDKFIEKRLPQFKKVFPEYRDFKLLGGIGALVVKDEVGRYAEKAGLYVLTQTDDGGAALWNRKNFKPKTFD